METKNIAALTRHHSDQPGFISINRKKCGEVEIIVREDGDYNKIASLVLSSNEFSQLVGEVVLSGSNIQ